jgi:membrane protein implicated in regulation of membrane protease activity
VTDTLIGKVGRATDAITPGQVGEVMIPIRGGAEAFYAHADERIPAGARVIVIEFLPPRTVYVERYAGVSSLESTTAP